LSDAAPRLFNANTFIRVEGTDRFINRREHLRCFCYFQRRVDFDQAAEDGLPFACVEPGQLIEDFTYAHRGRLRQPASGGSTPSEDSEERTTQPAKGQLRIKDLAVAKEATDIEYQEMVQHVSS